MAAGNSNPLPNEAQEEDAGDLVFPKEFENAETLLISEVFMLLDHRKTQNDEAEDEQVGNHRWRDVFLINDNIYKYIHKYISNYLVGAAFWTPGDRKLTSKIDGSTKQ